MSYQESSPDLNHKQLQKFYKGSFDFLISADTKSDECEQIEWSNKTEKLRLERGSVKKMRESESHKMLTWKQRL